MEEVSAQLLEAIAAEQPDPDLAEHARFHAAIVRDCRAYGIAAVFDAIEAQLSSSADIDENDLSALLERLELLQLDPRAATESVRLCGIALSLISCNGEPELWALLHAMRALAQRTLGEYAGNPQLLQVAVADSDVALEGFRHVGLPLDWAKTQMNRAAALLSMGDLAGDPGQFQFAIAGCDAALTVFTRDDQPADWALARMNRGVALQRLGQATLDRAMLRDGVAELHLALDVFAREPNSTEWAQAQLNLGVALLSLGDLEGDTSILRDALAGLEAAGTVFVPEYDPVIWARIRQNRANTLLRMSDLAGDPAAARAAVADFDDLLEVLTPEDSQSDWGITHLNRASALLQLHTLAGDAASLVEALAGYDAVLEVFTRRDAPNYWAAVQHNRASALVLRGQNFGDPAPLREAVAALDAVLEITPCDKSPAEWAAARLSRGLAMRTFGKLTRDRSVLLEAVADCDSAIAILAREAPSIHWAMAQQNRADAYVDLGNLTGDTNQLRTAVAGYDAALQSLTMDAHPDQCMEVSSALIRQLFLLGEIDDCRTRLDAILNSGLQHLVAIANPAARERAVQQAAGLAELRSWIAIAIDRDGEAALLWLERARGQLLALALAPDPHRAFAIHRGDLSIALRAIPTGGAAVLPIVSPTGTSVAVIPAGRDTVRAEDFVDLPELTHERFVEWFYGPHSESGITGYLGAHADGRLNGWTTLRNYGEQTGRSFPGALRAMLGRLWEHLIGPVHARLCDLALAPGAPVVIVPTGLLSMLPLGAAAPDGDTTPFGEHWTVSLSPSLGVLAVVRARSAEWEAQGAPVSMLAVLDPASDGQSRLAGAALEGRILAQMVGRERLLGLRGEDATASAVRAGLLGRTHVHFSAHGDYVPMVPSRSAVLLAGADRITLGELQAINAVDNLRLVVLSACDTGLPGLQRGRADEFIGLPAGFLQAGAAAVIASHWPVHDDATFFLMWKFYCEYLDEKGRVVRGPAEALRSANLWLRSVTCQDLEALFEPVLASDGSVIPRMIDRNRPRRGAADKALEGADTARTTSKPARVISFDAWRRFRRAEEARPEVAATDRQSVLATMPSAYFLGGDDEDWALSQPFADPAHWAAFSITGC